MYKNKIRKYRIKRGLTIKELADRCGVSAGYICHLEKGNRDLILEVISDRKRKEWPRRQQR